MLVGGVSQQLVQRQDVPGDLRHNRPERGISRGAVRGAGGMERGTEGCGRPPCAAPGAAVAGDTMARDAVPQTP